MSMGEKGRGVRDWRPPLLDHRSVDRFSFADWRACATRDRMSQSGPWHPSQLVIFTLPSFSQ